MRFQRPKHCTYKPKNLLTPITKRRGKKNQKNQNTDKKCETYKDTMNNTQVSDK